MRVLTTSSLELQPVRIGDVELVHGLWTNPDVRRFLFDEREIPLDEARSIVEQSVRSFEQHGYGIWFVCQRHTAELVGFAGLMDVSADRPNLIYGIHPDHWGSGFATEAAKAVLDFAFEKLGLASVKADVDEPNVSSVRVLEKLGMRQTHRAIVADRPLLYFELNARSRPDSRS